MMDKLKAVVSWEYFRAIKSKQFLVTTIIIPLIMALSGGVPLWLQQAQETRLIRFADTTGLLDGADAYLAAYHIELHDVMPSQSPGELLRSRQVFGVTMNREDQLPGVRLIVRDSGVDSLRLKHAVETYLTDMSVLSRVEAYGLSETELSEIFAPVTVTLERPVGPDERFEEATGPDFDVVPFAFAVMLMLAAFMCGTVLMQSVIKEKQNRIGEILFSSVAPNIIMNGKVIAFGALGIVQLFVWALTAMSVAFYFWNFDLSLIDPFSLIKGLPPFVAGYVMFSGMFAAVGAASRDAQAGGQIQGLFVMIPMIPLILTGAIVTDPHALWVKVLGYIPLFTPGIYLLRSTVATIPLWESVVCFAVATLGAVFVTRAAGRIFLYGMLKTGQPATIREVSRWVFGR